MAELHILGDIHSAYDFDYECLFCRYSFESGPNWSIVSGYVEGQTSADSALYQGPVTWSHPLDLHFVTKGIQGWPKIQLQVYCLDSFGRSWLRGYGSCAVPSTPGFQAIEVACWVPRATSLREKVTQYFLGGANQLLQPDLLFSSKDRYKLKTQSSGIVILKIEVILRHFDKFGVEYK